jgi:hypothetical protein
MTADTLEALIEKWHDRAATTGELGVEECAEELAALVRPGGVPQPETPRPLVDMDPRSRLIADFILAIDFETRNLILDPALAAIQRYDQSARPGAVEPPAQPEVHADLYQDCGHWIRHGRANRESAEVSAATAGSRL